jgi:hypothetical protein
MDWNSEFLVQSPRPAGPSALNLRRQRAMAAREQRNRNQNRRFLNALGIQNADSAPVRSLWSNAAEGPLVNNSVNLYANLANVGTKNIPAGSTNLISMENIKNQDEMVNFHNEAKFGHYYRKSNFNALTKNSSGKKKNPATRKIIQPSNAVKYKAKVGGRKRHTRRHN